MACESKALGQDARKYVPPKEGSGRVESETKTEKNAEAIIEESLPEYNNTLRALCTHAFILEIVSN